MGREKGVVHDTRAAPPPVEVQAAITSVPSGPIATPSKSPSSNTRTSTCSYCDTKFSNIPLEEFQSHVASCSRPTTSGSDRSSSALSTPPDSPSVDRLANLIAKDEDEKGHLSGEELPSKALGVADAGHQVTADAPVDEKLLEKIQRHDFGKISAYIKGEMTTYDSEDEEDIPDASAAPSDAEDSKPSPSPGLNGKESLQASQSSVKSGTSTSPQTPEEFEDLPPLPDSEITADPAQLASQIAKPKRPMQDADTKPKSKSNSLLLPNDDRKPISSKKSGLKFKKLTPIEAFESFLANPAEMSYEKLYHRTAMVAKTLALLQAEYDRADKQTDDYETAKKYAAKIAADARKEEDDKVAAASDAELLRLHAMYRDKVKMGLKEYNAWLEQHQKETNPETVPPGYWELLRQIKNPEIMGKVNKRRKLAEKDAAKPTTLLEDTPLPSLRKSDEDNRKRRNLFQDPIVFEDRKTADVYMADYSKHRDAVGYQVLKDRRAIIATEETDENGRPKRSRGKRAYDTEQTNTPGESEDEEAPLGKRRRTVRIVQDLPTSPARRRTATREGSPHVAVFKSGKRIGRPPKPKGDAAVQAPKSTSKSKLQQSHLPPVSEPAESEDSDDELAGAQTPRELDEHQEAQLQEAAESLVHQTQFELAGATTKGKHAGGRPKTKLVPARSQDGVNEEATVPQTKKKGGRAAPKAKVARVGRAKKGALQEGRDETEIDEENDVIQSTEQDDESHFDSASTSRPTTSSSAMTGASDRASRAASRAVTRELTARGMTAILNDESIGVQGPSPNAKGRGRKRKRAGISNVTLAPVGSIAPISKRRKTSGKKQKDHIPEGDEEQPATPEAVGEINEEFSVTASGRPKRKRASTITDSIYVALPGDPDDFVQEEDTSPPHPKRRKSGKARAAKKSKGFKGGEATESEFFTDAGDEIEVQPKKRIARVGVRKNMKQEPVEFEDVEAEDYIESVPKKSAIKGKGKGKAIQLVPDEETGGENPSGAYNPEGATQLGSEIPSGTQTPYDSEGQDIKKNIKPPLKKRRSQLKGAPPYSTLDNETGNTEQSGHEGDGEDGGMDPAAMEELRKKKQKSLKLAEATRERWAKGLMKGPMEKRAATNAAKKAAKAAAAQAAQGSHFDRPINGGVPASALTPNPFFAGPPLPPQPIVFKNHNAYITPYNAYSTPPNDATIAVAGHPGQLQYGAEYPPPQHTFQPPPTASNAPAPPPRSRISKPVPATKPTTPIKRKTAAQTEASSSSQATPQPYTQITAEPLSYSNQHTTPAPIKKSTRVRKPTRLALGYDGAGDEREEDQIRDQFRSEYDRYQALTSPRSPYTLGKRKRKSLMDLSAINADEDDSL